ncbi:uncharacterized protein DS421_14g466510 [Arachis hypogaea]|nr:uncharacterized protein DS421_14g466510 [Arachis hypogaea]
MPCRRGLTASPSTREAATTVRRGRCQLAASRRLGVHCQVQAEERGRHAKRSLRLALSPPLLPCLPTAPPSPSWITTRGKRETEKESEAWSRRRAKRDSPLLSEQSPSPWGVVRRCHQMRSLLWNGGEREKKDEFPPLLVLWSAVAAAIQIRYGLCRKPPWEPWNEGFLPPLKLHCCCCHGRHAVGCRDRYCGRQKPSFLGKHLVFETP